MIALAATNFTKTDIGQEIIANEQYLNEFNDMIDDVIYDRAKSTSNTWAMVKGGALSLGAGIVVGVVAAGEISKRNPSDDFGSKSFPILMGLIGAGLVGGTGAGYILNQPKDHEVYKLDLDSQKLEAEDEEVESLLYRCKGRNRASRSLTKLTDILAVSKIKELQTLRRTLMTWRNEILNYFENRITNARTEGYNRLITLDGVFSAL